MTLDKTRSNLLVLRKELDVVIWQLAFRRRMRFDAKAGFNQNQPRDERGWWTSEGGVETFEAGDFRTGISSIDETSEALSNTLVRVMETVERLPTMNDGTYGTAVHVAFGLALKLQNLPGVGDIERSFSLDDSDPRYGLLGTIRTDVTLRNTQGDVLAIYDVKTGDNPMPKWRANELREKVRASPETPVFELNIVRGVTRKFFLLPTNRRRTGLLSQLSIVRM